MAEEKKKPTSSRVEGAGVAESKAAPAVTEAKELSLEEKLAAAVGDISRHDADERQRRAEQARLEKEKEQERLARIEEEERLRLEREKASQLLKEQKLAAFEYAENYRKKLKRDKEKAKTAAQLRAEEEKAARLAAEREKKAKEIEEQIERERQEAKARAERAERILRAVTTCEVVDEQGNVRVVDRAELIAKQKAEAEAAANEAANAAEAAVEAEAAREELSAVEKEDISASEDSDKSAVSPASDPKENGEEADAEPLAIIEIDADDGEIADDGMIILPHADELARKERDESAVYDGTDAEDEYAAYMKAAAEYNDAARKYNEELLKKAEEKRKAKSPVPAKKASPVKKAPAPVAAPPKAEEPKPEKVKPNAEPAEAEEPREKSEPKRPTTVKRVVKEPWESEAIPPAVLDDDVVISILNEGKAVDDLRLLKKYLKRSDLAVEDFYNNVKKIERAIEKNHDRTAAPAAVIEVIQLIGKILEIRCDNVSVSAIMSEERYTKEYSAKLAEDIEEYNSRVASYALLTGEQLTRVSAFIPEHLSAGTGRAVIPVLSYREQYVELEVDENGTVIEENGNVTTNLVLPPFSAEEYIGADGAVESVRDCKRLAGTARSLLRRFDKFISANAKEIESNGKKQQKSLDSEAEAVQDRETAIRHLNARMPRGDRNQKKYAKRLAGINSHYASIILSERRERADAEYERKSLRRLVESFSAEREKVHTLMLLLHAVRGKADERDIADTKAALVTEMMEFNRQSEACGEKIDKKLFTLAATVADDIVRQGTKYPIPRMACRRELVETVGDSTRVVGDRIKSEYREVDDKPDNSNVFELDKTLGDVCLAREQIMIETLRELSEEAEDGHTYKRFLKKAKRTVKKLRATVKQTCKTIFRAVDEKSVYNGLLENIRIRGKLIEAGTICLSTAVKMHSRRNINKSQDALYDDIRSYNERAIDFESLTGEAFVRISAFMPESMAKGEEAHEIPHLNYKESYIEAFPNTPEAKHGFVDPFSRRAGEFTPLDCRNIRLTDNNILEITVIEPRITADGNIDTRPATTLRAARRTRWQTWRVLYGLDYSLRWIRYRQRRNARIAKRFDKKLVKLNKRFEARLFRLESSVPEARRGSEAYRKRSAKINGKYERALLKLRFKRIARAIERREMKLAVDEFVVYRERLEAQCIKLYCLRTWGGPMYVNAAKTDLINEIKEYNLRADIFSQIIGTPVTHASTNIVEQIMRNGKLYLLPKMLCCREMLESIGERSRAIGDKYRMGLPVTVNSQGVAVMTGTAYRLDSFGSPDIGIDKNGGPVLGYILDGLRYVGKPEAGAPPSKSITYVRKKDEADAPFEIAHPKEKETPLLRELTGMNGFLISAVLARGQVVGTPKELRMYLWRSKKAIKSVKAMISENLSLAKDALKGVEKARKYSTLITGQTGLIDLIDGMKRITSELEAKKAALDAADIDTKLLTLTASIKAAEDIGKRFAESGRSLSEAGAEALENDKQELLRAQEAYAEYKTVTVALAEEYAMAIKEIHARGDVGSQRQVYERFVRRTHLSPLSVLVRKHYEESKSRLDAYGLLTSLGIKKPRDEEYIAVKLLDVEFRRERLCLKYQAELAYREASISVLTDEIDAARLQTRALKRSERKALSKFIKAEEERLRHLKEQKKALGKALSNVDSKLNRRINRLNRAAGKVEKQLAALGSNERARNSKARYRIFKALDEARELKVLSAIYELRAISAHAKLIEIRSKNLFAASKIEMGRGSRFKCWLRGFGRNPRRKLYEELYEDINSYNERVVAAKEVIGNELSGVSVLMPEHIFSRTDVEAIPELIYRERFEEISHKRLEGSHNGVYRSPSEAERGGSFFNDGVSIAVSVNIPRMERQLETKELSGMDEYHSFWKTYKRIMRTIDKGISRIEADTDRIKEERDRLREKRVRIYNNYQHKVLAIARWTRETVRYQRRMRRALKWYRKKIIKVEYREANSSAVKSLRDSTYANLTAGSLILGLDGCIRKLSVQALVYERQRLLLSCRTLDRIFRAKPKLDEYAIAGAKRAVVDAMARYNAERDRCAKLIGKPELFRADNRILELVLKGRLDDAVALVPRVVCYKQLVEYSAKGEEAVSLYVLDPFHESKVRSD